MQSKDPTTKLLTNSSTYQGQTFMVIGTAGELPKAPEKPIVFLEGAAVVYSLLLAAR
jgi:hypothetical protein